MTTPRYTYSEIDRFRPFGPNLGLLPVPDPMCLALDFLGSFDADGLGEELVLSDFARFDLRAARLPSRRARGFYYAKLRGKEPDQAKGLIMAAPELDRIAALRGRFGLEPVKEGGTYRASARDEAYLYGHPRIPPPSPPAPP